MTMNLAHLHLLLNHVPTVGTVIAFAILMLSFIRRNEALRRVSLEVFCVIALLTLPAYLSGLGTMAEIRDRPEVSEVLMTRHHDAAVLGSIGMLLTGLFAWLGLWQFRRAGRQTGFNTIALLICSAVTIAFMARAATMGGEIRHPEILASPEVAEDAVDPLGPSTLSAAGIAAMVNENVWLWPSLEALHFVGLWLLFGVFLVVHMRALGMMTIVPYAAVHRLLPWGMLGLAMNIVTGMMWVIATPDQYLANVSFFWKILLLLIAGGNLIYMTAFEGPWHIGAGERAPLRVKAAAASAIALWIGVMYFGRMLPFIGNAF